MDDPAPLRARNHSGPVAGPEMGATILFARSASFTEKIRSGSSASAYWFGVPASLSRTWRVSISRHHIHGAWGGAQGGQEDDMPDKSTQPRLDAAKVSPALYKAMLGLEKYVEDSGLEQKLIDLVKIRASQINGCAYCIVMHTNDARKHGESDEWMHLLNAWHEAPIYSARERAALSWTEAVTNISDRHVPDEVYDEARKHFSEKELVDLTAAVIAINAWNRVAIAFRPTPPLKSVKLAA
jgi:AhpD family alkylhydroperoxidase